ncbi:tail fiber protein [Hymenobacter sp. M29]|uniref:Tail fiber protein n=1 Tax=Hymenobacter mellowenesis TaxID=3063995 RepID=A0ABT9AI99_9BACT|nr:tail fiber protein [Hymenobacter sp. M29]MDO7849597.1 tail fiber protein [Hymenobacter sp. M29]
MDEPFIGEIRPISFNYAPRNWAFCNGQLLPINQYQALFSLLGTTFGGNGTTTFALPDLRSRVPMGAGQLPGGTNYLQGQVSGSENVTLIQTQLPAHQHTLTGTLQSSDSPESDDPTNKLPALEGRAQFTNGAANAPMGTISGTAGNAGLSQAHNNRQPYVGINYVIAITGIYPSRA